MSEWMPIETAPKDGTEVLVMGLREQFVAWYKRGYWLFCEKPEGQWAVNNPTHWMPLPEPPTRANLRAEPPKQPAVDNKDGAAEEHHT